MVGEDVTGKKEAGFEGVEETGCSVGVAERAERFG
jgi:hypothetical protein